MRPSVSKAIRIVQQAGLRLESDGEGLWRVEGGDWIDCARLVALAVEIQAAPAS